MWKKYDGEIATVLSLAITVAIALLGYARQNVLATTIAVAALGGIVHEIAQTGGKFMLPGKDEKDPKNVYLGGLYGLIAGGVAGLLLAQGVSQPGQLLAQGANSGLSTNLLTTNLLSEAFLAGLGLKGVSEAVADQTVAPAQQK
jgi:hypothetical protein